MISQQEKQNLKANKSNPVAVDGMSDVQSDGESFGQEIEEENKSEQEAIEVENKSEQEAREEQEEKVEEPVVQ